MGTHPPAQAPRPDRREHPLVRENPAPTAARGQAGLLARFEREVDPEGTLPPAERARRVEAAKKAHFQRLALRSAQVRSARKAAAEEATPA